MMNKRNNWIAAIAALLLTAQAYAGDVRIDDAWARATAPGQENGSVGLVITSAKDARLIAVITPVAKFAEIHTMSMENGVMKMRQLEDLPLPAKQPVKLGPGGDHLMLFSLKNPLKAGEEIPLTLTIQFPDKSTKKISIKAQIKSLTAGRDNHHAH